MHAQQLLARAGGRYNVLLMCRSFAVFLHIKELLHLPGSGHTVDKLPEDFKASSVFDTTFWVPDADIEDVIKKIDLVSDIAPTLQVR